MARTSRKAKRQRRRTTQKAGTASKSAYLFYLTPGFEMKIKRLGGSPAAAEKALEKWAASVRGKKYQALDIVLATSVAEARKSFMKSVLRPKTGRSGSGPRRRTSRRPKRQR